MEDQSSIQLLEELSRPIKPYAGDIKEPTTELDNLVRNVIYQYGNDNILRLTDPYERTPRRRLDPGVRSLDAAGRQEFGEDYLTHHASLRRNSAAKIIFLYNKQYGRAEVIVDDFRTDQGEGLASRTTFTGWEEHPETIYKKRQTDFTSYLGQVGIGEFIDFSRELKESEVETMRGVFSDLSMLHQLSPRSPSETKLVREFNNLVGESKSETKQKAKNRKEFDLRMNEHHQAMEAIARSHVLVRPRRSPV